MHVLIHLNHLVTLHLYSYVPVQNNACFSTTQALLLSVHHGSTCVSPLQNGYCLREDVYEAAMRPWGGIWKVRGEPAEIVCGIPTFRADTKGIQIHDMGRDSQISQRFLTACNNKKLQKIATLQATDLHRSLATPYMSQLPWCRFLSTTGRQ
jgi:hypothetical protein